MRGHAPEIRALAVRLYLDRVPMADIQLRCHGVSPKAVLRWVRAAGHGLRGIVRSCIFGPEVRARAVAMYRAGVRMLTIQAATGADDQSIRQWVRDAGVPMRRTHTLARLVTAEVLRLDQEHGPNRAAQLLGCSPASVHYHREKARRERIRAELRGRDG